jgi:very-short-patch-repair endonuclease
MGKNLLLESRGFKVWRFWNNEVLNNMEDGLDALTLALSQRERVLEQKK